MLGDCWVGWKRRHNASVDASTVSSSENSMSPEESTIDGMAYADMETSVSSLSSQTGTNVLPLGEKKRKDLEKARRKEAQKRSEKCDLHIKNDWKNEQKYIKLLLLGPGEAGKSTLIKQMQLIHGEALDHKEKVDRIPHIRQNIFDSMVAILVAMKEFNIPLEDQSLGERAQILLRNSQVCNPQLSSKDILNSEFLKTDEFLLHVECLWEDEGVKRAYARSNEYQLLDCASYFFNRIEAIKQSGYIPNEQDMLRSRVMTTSITETKFTVPYGNNQKGNFKVLDVGGQRGDRRKWITLFDRVTAVLFVQDISSFDQTLREDSKTNRLLESLKVFYQVITTKYLRSVSILTFMNKIDILKEKIERGADFGAALKKMQEEAAQHAEDTDTYSDYDRQIYKKLLDILLENPYESFKITDSDKKLFCDAFPAPDADHNHNGLSLGKKISGRFISKKSSNSSLYTEMNEEVVKAATYMRLLLKKIIDKVEDRHGGLLLFAESEFRSYEFHYTCAVDKNNITKVLEGCKNIIIKDHLVKWGIPLYS